MTGNIENPWVERFTPLLNRDEIRRKVALPPRQLSEYEQLSPADASKAFEKRLEETFFPSKQCIDILSEWIGLAFEHCRNYYHGQREFLEALYDKEPPLPSFNFPMCLTGLAGTGKSQVLKALNRLMPEKASFTSLDETVFRLESHRILTVKVQGSATDILKSLTGHHRGMSELTMIARKLAYRDGWGLLGVDEFQFLTQSDNANTRLMQVLMSVCYLGIPVVYVANFSMLHKLGRRNQEDRQRLLGNVWGLFPESPNSPDWVGVLEWHKSIAPDIFEFDAETDADAIHHLTGGINRAENKLMSVAFRRALESGHVIRLGELEAVYKSTAYASYRKDLELLTTLPYSKALQKRHTDLWCPFDIASRIDSQEAFSMRRQKRVDEAAIEASLNASERSALKSLTKAQPKPKSAKVVSIDRKSPVEQLKDDAAWFDENL